MKITSRELILLFALIGTVLLYVLYVFLFNPLYLEISVAKENLAALQEQERLVEQHTIEIPALIKQQEVVSAEAEEKVQAFLPDLKEDILATFFVSTIGKGGPAIDDVYFDTLNPVNLDSLIPVPVAKVSYPYGDKAGVALPEENPYASTAPPPGDGDPSKTVLGRGVVVSFNTTTYEQAINQLKAVEALKRTIIVDAFSLSVGETGMEGSIGYSFYGLDKLTDEDPGLAKTPLTEAQGKTNPFI